MQTTRTHNLLAAALVSALAFTTVAAQAGEIGHFAPGVANIRDYTVPEPGFYGAVYDYWYSTTRLNDGSGNKINSVNVDVNIYAVAPMFIWVSDWKVLGAKYAAYIAPSFGSASVDAALDREALDRLGVNASRFGVGDLFVQPLWLGWSLTNWDFALGYGFYAPIGTYNTQTVSLRGGGSTKLELPDNIGFGFWEQQIQGAVSWYPWADKRMAVSAVLTYGIPQKKDDFDLTPGENLTLNWGISQYLPLNKAQTLLLEVGPAGYDSWQVTSDSGSDASSGLDQVHAVGGQFGFTYVPWLLSVNFHGFYEYAARDRFQGQSFGLNIVKKF